MAMTTNMNDNIEQERNYTLKERVVEGMNTYQPGSGIPVIGEGLTSLISPVSKRIKVAKPIETKEFIDFYNGVQKDLKEFGPFFDREMYFDTEQTTLVDVHDCKELASEHPKDLLQFGSYIVFGTVDRRLEGRLYVGHEADLKLLEEGGEDLTKRVEVAAKHLGKQWKGIALDGIGLKIGSKIPYALGFATIAHLATIGFTLDIARHLYNSCMVDAHWRLEIKPKKIEGKPAKFTQAEFETIRFLNERHQQ